MNTHTNEELAELATKAAELAIEENDTSHMEVAWNYADELEERGEMDMGIDAIKEARN